MKSESLCKPGFLSLKHVLKNYVFKTGIVTPEKEPKVNTVVGAQQLLLAKEEDGAAKKSKPPEDNKFCHEQVKGNVTI